MTIIDDDNMGVDVCVDAPQGCGELHHFDTYDEAMNFVFRTYGKNDY